MTNCGLELFKSELDRFPELLPDEPSYPDTPAGEIMQLTA